MRFAIISIFVHTYLVLPFMTSHLLKNVVQDGRTDYYLAMEVYYYTYCILIGSSLVNNDTALAFFVIVKWVVSSAILVNIIMGFLTEFEP